jgi:hypothetical protein
MGGFLDGFFFAVAPDPAFFATDVVEPGRFFVAGFFFARIPASISSAPMGTASVTLAFL